MNYEALIALSVVVWRVIGAFREPVLYPLRGWLVKQLPKRGIWYHSLIVWMIAFGIGYVAATMSGQ